MRQHESAMQGDMVIGVSPLGVHDLCEGRRNLGALGRPLVPPPGAKSIFPMVPPLPSTSYCACICERSWCTSIYPGKKAGRVGSRLQPVHPWAGWGKVPAQTGILPSLLIIWFLGWQECCSLFRSNHSGKRQKGLEVLRPFWR
jgi:hypothetical protein